jgi:DNA-binding transcriptional LysR family regulator
MNWDDLRYFLAIHRAGSLVAAARQLNVNPTTVGRRLEALERELKSPLFHRTPSGYQSTEAGLELLPRAERIEQEMLAVERELDGADQRVDGTVRLSATEMMATRFIMPHLPALRERHPRLQLELLCTQRSVDLARREADIALRLARPREPNLIARQLADIPLSLYAAHSYLARRGTPQDAGEQLAGQDVLMFADTPAFAIENTWLERRSRDAAVVLRSDSVSSIYSAVVAGAGIALLPRVVADLDPALVRIPTRDAPQPRTIWQTIHEDLRGSARVRAVTTFLTEILSVQPNCRL